jgi:hypothetical protein
MSQIIQCLSSSMTGSLRENSLNNGSTAVLTPGEVSMEPSPFTSPVSSFPVSLEGCVQTGYTTPCMFGVALWLEPECRGHTLLWQGLRMCPAKLEIYAYCTAVGSGGALLGPFAYSCCAVGPCVACSET